MKKSAIKKTLVILIIITIILAATILIIGKKSNLEKSEENETADDDEILNIKLTNLEIQAQEIKSLISNKWYVKNINFGTMESTCNEYDIYFDEGIEIKTVASKVFNIVFTKKYSKNIVNNLKTISSKDEIVKTLGEPSFSLTDEELYIDKEIANEERFLVGYKSEDIYIFFSNSSISVYPVIEENKTELEQVIKILEKLSKEKDINQFIENIKEVWNDFDIYEPNAELINLGYSLKGFLLNWNNYLGKRNRAIWQFLKRNNKLLHGK